MTKSNSNNISVKTWEQVLTEILHNIDNTAKNVLIQAGHFSLLFNKNKELVPSIEEEIKDLELRQFVAESNYMGDFPFVTLKNSIPLALSCKQMGMNVKFAFIVNDWQWIKNGLYTAFPTDRKKFFSKTSLPQVYMNLLEKNSFTVRNIIAANHFSKNGIYFSEHKLRKIGKKKVTSCSPMSCAIEYLPFLQDVLDTRDMLISFIPFSCKIPVLYAAIKYIQSREQRIDLFHIFYNPLTKEKELSFMNKDSLQDNYVNDIVNQFHIMEMFSK